MRDDYGNEITWLPRLSNSALPVYKQIAEAIEIDVEEGILIHGSKLPPQRVIANQLKVNHGTVTRAYKLCEEKGLVKGIIGKGTFISGCAGLPVELLTDHDESDIISLGMALPVYELNQRIEQMIKEVMETMDYATALKYCPPEGHLRHRYIAANWLKGYKIKAIPENIIISSGTQNALAVILISLFTKSDRIIVDELTYTGLKSLAEYLGIILVPVKSGDEGIYLDDLEITCRRENIKGIYMMADCHNPTSVVLNVKHRKGIAEVVKKYDLLLIEDGTCSFTVEDRLEPISTYIPDHSFYIHGTSKALSPALRLSYLVAPERYVKRLQQGINNLTWMASPFTSEIMSLLQSTGRYEQVVRMKIEILRERNALFDKIFKDYESIPSETALFRYLKLRPEHQCQLLEQMAFEAGVQVFDVNRFHVGVDQRIKALRISISSAKNMEELEKGLTILRDLMDNSLYGYNPIV